jgi:hypothetical protein
MAAETWPCFAWTRLSETVRDTMAFLMELCFNRKVAAKTLKAWRGIDHYE